MEIIDDRYRDAVAREIKKAYVERKSALIGRPWKPSSRHQSFALWQKAADQAISLNAPAEAYVCAAFRNCRMSTGPFPNNLGGPAAHGWWQEYVKQNPGYREEREQLDAQGIPDANAMTIPAVAEIKADLQHLRSALYQMTGEQTWPPLGPKSLEIVLSEVLPMPPHMRLILAYPDERLLQYYGREMMENFEKRPDILRAMQTLGYDLIEIISWLRQS
jgi:hypothetical protein